ncbi:MAG: glycosyltransferase family 2 protein [candidate division WOR-3 bacterium]|nr:glycosyltransferase family 2 protein [candidate division WOR-3 bacterium]
MKASAIVVSYNRGVILSHCIDKLLKQTATNYEVIVVDDGSTDETKELMEKIKDPRFKYYRNEKKMGQPYARNRGIKEAKGEIIIFVDSDVLVDRKFINDHLRLHKKDDKLIVQGMVRHIKKTEDYGKSSLLIDGFCLAGLITQNVSVKKKWLEEAGGFDESFVGIMGYMDVEIGRRLKGLGLKTIYAFRSCLAWHLDGYETEERIRAVFDKSYQRGKNAVKLSEKYGKRVAARHLKKSYVDFITKLFGTEQWVENKGVDYLIIHRDSFLFPILKWIMKYHYRGKGIRKAIKEKEKGGTHNSPS